MVVHTTPKNLTTASGEQMSRKIGKKRQVKFINDVKAFLKEVGAEDYTGSYTGYQYHIDTIAGKLKIHISDDQSYVFSIFCRFDDVKKAVEELDGPAFQNLNEFSGKWNFHSSHESGIEFFKSELSLITIK